jgi:hypothetical protein
MTIETRTPPHICQHCGERMMASGKPVQWSADRKGYEHVVCAASATRAA